MTGFFLAMLALPAAIVVLALALVFADRERRGRSRGG